MGDVLYYQNYTHMADLSTIVICILHCFLLHSTYTFKQKNLNMFRAANAFVLFAAATNIIYHELVAVLSESIVIWVYICRNASYILLMLTYVFFCIYVSNLMDMKGKKRQRFFALIWVAFAFFSFAEITAPLGKWGFYIDEKLQIHQNYYLDIFWFAYIFYSVTLTALLVVHRRKFITKIYRCICSVGVICFLIILWQALFMNTSYTCITFTFPIMALLFLFHYNSYDQETGTLDYKTFDAYIQELVDEEFSVISLYLHEMHADKMKDLSEYFFHFNEKYFKDACTFRLRDDKLALIYPDVRNKNSKEKIPVLLQDFRKLYDTYKIDYRIVIMHSNAELVGGRDYLALNEFVERKMKMNTVYWCTDQDIKAYLKSKYILEELQDINHKQDLDDERVKVFCQPVLNTKTNTFTSAEALMRLELMKCGMVLPDEFISLAEKNGYIHTLSKIILNKTCKQMKYMEQQGYNIERVSVNFSITELKDKRFCDDVTEIIRANGIPYEKIAIELTESKNEKDFENVKDMMTTLQELGVKFYLDDFGTGYSNFERIIGLPIDIIKFDRSLTIMAGKDDESKFLVGSFSDIFKQSNYQILFEGIENEEDERYCKQMNALYLQGFKYSHPIPIEQLTEFLTKENK